ncbi:MAG: hypothetical protein ACTHN0_12790 [Aquihabitans sp.]
MTAVPPIRRVRDGAEIEDLCEPHQPVALLVSSPVNEASKHLKARCWVVGPPGAELGAVTTTQLRPDLVAASALVLDPDAAPVLADLVRRSGATRLSGGADHVGPIADLIPGSAAFPLQMLGVEHQALPASRAADPDAGGWPRWARPATEGDLPVLVDLYQQFPLEFLDGDRLALALRHLVREHRVFVIEVDGVVVGAQRIEAQARRWNFWGGVTIPPEHRGQGLSRWLHRCGDQRSEVDGRGNAGVVAPTNPIDYVGDGMISEPWLEVRLPVVPSVCARGKRWTRRQVRSLRDRSAEVGAS